MCLVCKTFLHTCNGTPKQHTIMYVETCPVSVWGCVCMFVQTTFLTLDVLNEALTRHSTQSARILNTTWNYGYKFSYVIHSFELCLRSTL